MEGPRTENASCQLVSCRRSLTGYITNTSLGLVGLNRSDKRYQAVLVPLWYLTAVSTVPLLMAVEIVSASRKPWHHQSRHKSLLPDPIIQIRTTLKCKLKNNSFGWKRLQSYFKNRISQFISYATFTLLDIFWFYSQIQTPPILRHSRLFPVPSGKVWYLTCK
jgi:hypothetical protein